MHDEAINNKVLSNARLMKDESEVSFQVDLLMNYRSSKQQKIIHKAKQGSRVV
jgi:hypothetical protein